ncbi:hypothetical protein I7I51_05018 [Histoplasma capsulatum]|uniref:Uncharacterized protein n=1 Tax=Ajellomyces capsulatus TaxID=5037 RepID=A0A8A1M2J0_AJECA|nr:hypothetical protein I7I51_05018 [Histoplasma capsulatum]
MDVMNKPGEATSCNAGARSKTGSTARIALETAKNRRGSERREVGRQDGDEDRGEDEDEDEMRTRMRRCTTSQEQRRQGRPAKEEDWALAWPGLGGGRIGQDLAEISGMGWLGLGVPSPVLRVPMPPEKPLDHRGGDGGYSFLAAPEPILITECPAVMGRQSYRSSRRDQSRSCRRKGPQLALVQLCAVGLGSQCLYKYKFCTPPCVPQHVSSWLNAGYYSNRLCGVRRSSFSSVHGYHYPDPVTPEKCHNQGAK